MLALLCGGGQPRENHVLRMLSAQHKPIRGAQVFVKHSGKRVAIGNMKIAQSSYGYVELDWVDVTAKQPRRHAAAQNVFDTRDQGQGEFGDLARLTKVTPTLKILRVDESDVILVLLKKSKC